MVIIRLHIREPLLLTPTNDTCDTQPNELNNTTNATVFNSNGLGQLKDNLTGSNFPTYVSEIGLYDDQTI